MSTLPQAGTTFYNGFNFPVETETLSCVATPVQDQAKRTIVYVVYSISLRFRLYVAPPTTMDATMDTVRKQLTAQGGTFWYQNKGLGTISVNIPTGAGLPRRDVCWGPVPGPLRMKMIGQNAVDCEWSITVAVPECDAAKYEGRIMEYNYRLLFAIGQNGYQKRTYSGFIRIPMTRRSVLDRTIPWNVDDWRLKLTPNLLRGFHRSNPGTITIDESKTRLDFVFEDTEIGPNFPPAGCVTASASHEYHNTGTGKLNQYVGTITAEYEIIRGTSPYVAYNAFNDLVQNRVDTLLAEQGPVLLSNKVKPTIIPLTFSASEPEIYGPPKAKFSLSYAITFDVRLLLVDALWYPVPGSDWSKWAKVMALGASHPNGNARLGFNTKMDAIMDLCIAEKNIDTTIKSFVTGAKIGTLTSVFPNSGIDEFTSWLLYENNLRIVREDTTAIHRTLATTKLSSNSSSKDNLESTTGWTGTTSKEPDTVIQQRSDPIWFVVMEGRAIRVGFEIPEPKLTSLGGVPTFQYFRPGDGFSQGIVGNVGLPIYAAKWRISYVLPRSPKSAPPAEVPQTFTGSSSTSTSTLKSTKTYRE